jgi:nicotinate-nucleotide--dimethylbenzimidazole phosphoribosyltransferase
MFSSLTAFSEALDDLPPANAAWRSQAQARQQQLTKPAGSLGRLEDCAVFLAGWGHAPVPRADRMRVIVFAGNHGVTARGVSPFPAEVTAQMVANFAHGGAAINAISAACGAELEVVPLSLDAPTADISRAPALSEDELLAALNAGAAAVAQGGDILAFGEMGIGNTTIAAAIGHALYGGAPVDWVGPGTGVDPAGLGRKADAVGRAVGLHKAHLADPLEVLRRLGGREIAAMAGAILAARTARVPVPIDGYVASAAAAIVHAMAPGAIDHCMAAHRSAEPAHAAMLQRMGKAPLLDLGMRLGEGTGAGLAVMLARAACELHAGMATFAEAGVSDKED